MSHATLSFGRLARPTMPLQPLHAVAVALALVMAWAVWAAVFNTAQFGDNIEQFGWAQSLELGYRKHPPLPSWVLGAVVRLFGPSIYWAYALSTLCLLGTAWFTWLIGRRLIGERAAAAAVVLWGLNLAFSQRVQLYNHNTVLVLCIGACVWLAMRAMASPRHPNRWWLAAGAVAGAAMLSKYQALVPLGGLALVCAVSMKPGERRRLGLAAAAMALVFAPHAVWMVQHDFSTLRYASEAVQSSGLLQRLGFIASFIANQARMAFPALLALALCAWLVKPGMRAASSVALPALPWRLWMFGLLWAGLGVLVVMALVAGVSLRNHWGVQALQFLSLWIACRWDRRAPINLRGLVGVALAVHAGSFAWYAAEHREPSAVLSSRRIDTLYPAQRLAGAAVGHWTDSTSCPLKYVSGDGFDAGLVALYSGGRLAVFESEAATPWVLADDIKRRGALYVLAEGDEVPAGVTNLVDFDVVPGDRHGRPAKTLRLGTLLPERTCQ